MAKGEESGKRVSRLRWFALGCLAGVAGVWAMCAIGLRVNGTDSEPIGIYWAISKPPARGDFVFALPPDTQTALCASVAGCRSSQNGHKTRADEPAVSDARDRSASVRGNCLPVTSSAQQKPTPSPHCSSDSTVKAQSCPLVRLRRTPHASSHEIMRR
jgi:hypothetical protein